MNHMNQLKNKIHQAFNDGNTVIGKIIGSFLLGLIILSGLLFMGENLPEFQPIKPYFETIDQVILIVFTIEYILRIWSAPNRRRAIFSFFGIIDLMVILPLLGFFPNIAFLRGLRVLEIFRMLKVIRQSSLFVTFIKSLKHYTEEFKIFGLSFCIVLIVSAFSIYTVEHPVNPEFSSIKEAVWWSFVSMSTVGYGDITPITGIGKLIASATILLGLGTIAMMTAILTKSFIDHFFGKRPHKCNFCHYPHHDHDAQFCKNCGQKLDMPLIQKTTTAS
ncbi:Ion transporter [bacterium DOLZORAL124_38_8]|nr:MAG: Ion transporter [bacterium DOLZORAL124_38_8]